MNIFNSLLAQLVKYDVHTTRKIEIDTCYFLSHIIIVLSLYIHSIINVTLTDCSYFILIMLTIRFCCRFLGVKKDI